MKTQEFLNIDDACELFSISKASMYKIMERDKDFPRLKIGGSIRFDKEEIISYFKSKGKK